MAPALNFEIQQDWLICRNKENRRPVTALWVYGLETNEVHPTRK